MAITTATLAQETDGVVEYIYPKTIADIVEYDTTQNVKEKIESLDANITATNTRIESVENIKDDFTSDTEDIKNRLSTLETIINTLQANYNTMSATVSNLKTTVTNIENNMSNNTVTLPCDGLDLTTTEF